MRKIDAQIRCNKSSLGIFSSRRKGGLHGSTKRRSKCNNYISGEKSAISEVKNLHVLKCKNVMSRSEGITLQEVKNIHTNKNNINNTELSNTESNLIVSGNDGIGLDVQAYAELIRDNIDLDILLERHPFEKELLNGIFDLILEIVLCRNAYKGSNPFLSAIRKP